MDIDYDTYYRFDLYKPLCTYIMEWLYNRGIRWGSVLVAGPFMSPVSMFLKKCGFDVTCSGLIQENESWKDFENHMLLSDLNLLKDVSESYDVIICDDIFYHTDTPGDILRVLRERLRPEGIFLLTMENTADGNAWLSVFTGNHVKAKHSHDDEGVPGSSRKEEKGLHVCGYTAGEAVELVSGAGFSIHQRRYPMKEEASEGSMFPVPVSSYIQKNASYFIQKVIPSLRSHIFIAARKNRADV